MCKKIPSYKFPDLSCLLILKIVYYVQKNIKKNIGRTYRYNKLYTLYTLHLSHKTKVKNNRFYLKFNQKKTKK